jgi:chemotaxis methyl-accepting protein methylase
MQVAFVLISLYGCETGFLREEHRLTVFKNRILKKIFCCEGGHQRRLEKDVGGRAS